MHRYTLIAANGMAYRVDEVRINDSNATVTFRAAFDVPPTGLCKLRRDGDGKSLPVMLGRGPAANDRREWKGVLAVRP